MGQKMGQVVYKHIEEHLSLYLFNMVLFVMGIIFGTLTIYSLGYAQQHDLYTYFQQFLDQFTKATVAPSEIFSHHLGQDLKYVGIIWLLGLSIIGLPIILVMIFLKGVFVGFSVGFLVHQMGWRGFWLSLVSIIPQNMVMVPVILVISVASITFSLRLAAYLFSSSRSYRKISLGRYIGLFVLASFALVVVALFQSYLSPFLMSKVL